METEITAEAAPEKTEAEKFDVYSLQERMYMAFKVSMEDAVLYAEAESKLRLGYDYLVVNSNDTIIVVYRGGKRFLLTQA